MQSNQQGYGGGGLPFITHYRTLNYIQVFHHITSTTEHVHVLLNNTYSKSALRNLKDSFVVIVHLKKSPCCAQLTNLNL